MADRKRFEVLTEFRARTAGLERGLGKAISLAGTAAKSLGSFGLAAAGLGGFAVSAGIALATRKMVSLNSELETSRISLATILQTASKGGQGPFESFNVAIAESNRLLGEFQKRGAKLPGTADEFGTAFQLLLPTLAKTGASVDEIMDTAANALVTAKVGRVLGGAEIIARDINQILAGSVSVAEVSAPLKEDAQRIAKLAKTDLPKAAKEIQKVLETSPEALNEFANTFDARSSTFQDSMSRFVRDAGGPVFEFVSQKLDEWNQWLEKNDTMVKEIAKTVGTKLVSALEGAVVVAKDLGQAFLHGAGYIEEFINRVYSLAGREEPFGGTNESRAKELGLDVVSFDTVRNRLLKGELSAAEQAAALAALREDVDSFRNPGFFEWQTDRWSRDRTKMSDDKVLNELVRDRLLSPESETRLVQKVFDARVATDKRSQAYGDLGFQEMGLNLFSAAPGSKVHQNALALIEQQKQALRFKPADKPPTVDARGSTFHFEQNFTEGDPERIYFEVRREIMRPMLPLM